MKVWANVNNGRGDVEQEDEAPSAEVEEGSKTEQECNAKETLYEGISATELQPSSDIERTDCEFVFCFT